MVALTKVVCFWVSLSCGKNGGCFNVKKISYWKVKKNKNLSWGIHVWRESNRQKEGKNLIGYAVY